MLDGPDFRPENGDKQTKRDETSDVYADILPVDAGWLIIAHYGRQKRWMQSEIAVEDDQVVRGIQPIEHNVAGMLVEHVQRHRGLVFANYGMLVLCPADTVVHHLG